MVHLSRVKRQKFGQRCGPGIQLRPWVQYLASHKHHKHKLCLEKKIFNHIAPSSSIFHHKMILTIVPTMCRGPQTTSHRPHASRWGHLSGLLVVFAVAACLAKQPIHPGPTMTLCGFKLDWAKLGSRTTNDTPSSVGSKKGLLSFLISYYSTFSSNSHSLTHLPTSAV